MQILAILAFGWTIGINPPVDIHVPTPEEIAIHIQEEIERKEKRDDPNKDIH